MQRDAMVQIAKQKTDDWDIAVIGGGVTGASIALDAASRGYQVILLEQSDFGKGTSSRSTKLVHGGVRYLAQGNISLVRDALRERTRLATNAPHVVHERSFVVPCGGLFEFMWYRLGLVVYDALAGTSNYRRSSGLTGHACLEAVPTLRPERARWGVRYSDGQFDDARLLIDLVRTACDQGAVAINYASVIELNKSATGKLNGLRCIDQETGEEISIGTRCIVNACGPFCDAMRKQDEPTSESMIAASQGVHIVLPKDFLPGDSAIIVPKTSDGRVLFLIPWHERVLVGTTDTPISGVPLEPRATDAEIEFLLKTSAEYLVQAPRRSDILSVFTGIRPLVKPKRAQGKTSSISRDHTIEVSQSGLITITGGKWTTARKMAQDCVDQCIAIGLLPNHPCQTAHLPIQSESTSVHQYVKSAEVNEQHVIRWVRDEMARTVEDVLARRTRWLFLDVAAAEAMAPQIATWMAQELGRDARWVAEQVEAFKETAACFRIPGMAAPSTPQES
ncbi:MAG: glycerol-3-phosphate dehydrogenase/oxidase [Pirellula sp.]|nr:glycerol-3-phosphate dehydrogenase/oxidase [Pirellula sp.]